MVDGGVILLFSCVFVGCWLYLLPHFHLPLRVHSEREREREFVALMNQVLFVARRIIELLLADCVHQPSRRNNKSRDIRAPGSSSSSFSPKWPSHNEIGRCEILDPARLLPSAAGGDHQQQREEPESSASDGPMRSGYTLSSVLLQPASVVVVVALAAPFSDRWRP